MALNRFRNWLMALRWQHRILVTISIAVLTAGLIAPPLFVLLGGSLGLPIVLTALVTAAIVSPPLVYTMAMIEKIAAYHKDLAEEAMRETERRNEIFQSLLESSVAMQQSGQLVALLDGMLMRLHRLLPDNRFGIIVDSSRPKMVRYFTSHGISDSENRLLIQNNHLLLEPAQQSVIERLSSLDATHHHWQFLPMHGRNGQVIGKLIVKGEKLHRSDEEVLTIFLEQLTAATENKLLTIELEKLANTDNLTGVYNRNYFNHELERQFELKNGKPGIDFSLLVIDINGLKGLNDSLGHVAGDRLITATADLLLSSCREEDTVARIGGDEFVVICPGTARDQARQLQERILRRSHAQTVKIEGKEKGRFETVPLQMSIGIASSAETQDAASVLSLADERMYEAKRAWYATRQSSAV